MNLYSKINALLTPPERLGAWKLLGLMVIGMLMETLGIGLVVPAISIIMQDDFATRYPSIANIASVLEISTKAELIIATMLILVGVYVAKNAFLAFLIWKQTKFSFDAQANISQRLFATYLHQPYTYHLQKNSAILIRNVINEVSVYIGGMLGALMLFTEIMVLIGISLLLLFVEPRGTLIIICVVGVLAGSFYHAIRNHISQWGRERQMHEGMRMQHLQQGLGGAKDVKLLGRENNFLEQFFEHNKKSARIWTLQSAFLNYPRLFIELVAIIGLAILVMSMVNQGHDVPSIIPTLGLFAAAAFRLIPSVGRVMNSLQTLRFSLPVVNTLYEELKIGMPKASIQQNRSPIYFQEELSLKNIIYYYPNTSLPALDSVSVTIRKGESIGLIGASGSGKSTMVDVILGLLAPSAGCVRMDGNDIQKNLRQWQDQIGYVPQAIYLTDDTLKKNVAFGLSLGEIDDFAVSRAIKAAQLEEFVTSLPKGLETIVGERGVRLSGGQRQRIGIARALYRDPSVLVLDEATSALDGETERGVMEAVTLFKGSKTIIVVAHRLSTVKNCDRLFRLERGRVVDEGSPEEILFRYEKDFKAAGEIAADKENEENEEN